MSAAVVVVIVVESVRRVSSSSFSWGTTGRKRRRNQRGGPRRWPHASDEKRCGEATTRAKAGGPDSNKASGRLPRGGASQLQHHEDDRHPRSHSELFSTMMLYLVMVMLVGRLGGRSQLGKRSRKGSEIGRVICLYFVQQSRFSVSSSRLWNFHRKHVWRTFTTQYTSLSKTIVAHRPTCGCLCWPTATNECGQFAA